MKPNNSHPPKTVWGLKDDRGGYYACSTQESGVMCTGEARYARKYATQKGATTAGNKILQAYGKQTKPVCFEFVIQERVTP